MSTSRPELVEGPIHLSPDASERAALLHFLAANRGAAFDLDDPITIQPDEMVGEVTTARGVLLHVIEETARHAGHLDIARELMDGRTGLGPR